MLHKLALIEYFDEEVGAVAHEPPVGVIVRAVPVLPEIVPDSPAPGPEVITTASFTH